MTSQHKYSYVDNLSIKCSEDDLRSFVGTLGVNVISCYKVTPRHRRGRAPDQNRAAFRLCVARCDLEKVLEPTAWPDCVTISEWFFMDPTEHSNRREKRSRFYSPPDQHADVVVSCPTTSAARDESDNMESTMIYAGTDHDNETGVKSALAEITPENGVGTR